MQEFQYKMLEDETFAVTGYSGEEKEVVSPDTVTDIGELEFFFAPGTKLSPLAFESKEESS